MSPTMRRRSWRRCRQTSKQSTTQSTKPCAPNCRRPATSSKRRHARPKTSCAKRRRRRSNSDNSSKAYRQKLRSDAQSAQAAQEQIRLAAHTAQEKLRQELQAKIDAAVAAQARAADLAKSNDAQLRAARAQAEAARAELDATKVDLSGADGQMERLLVSFETLAGASSITDLLTALAETLASEFKRVALFRLKGNKLQGEYQTGSI